MMNAIGHAPALGLCAGAALAIVYLAALALNVRLYMAAVPAWRSVGLHVMRLGATLLAFTLLARVGAAALVGALAGFSIARLVVLGRYG